MLSTGAFGAASMMTFLCLLIGLIRVLKQRSVAPRVANADQWPATSRTASANAFGASCGRLCPMPPVMSRCEYFPENFLA